MIFHCISAGATSQGRCCQQQATRPAITTARLQLQLTEVPSDTTAEISERLVVRTLPPTSADLQPWHMWRYDQGERHQCGCDALASTTSLLLCLDPCQAWHLRCRNIPQGITPFCIPGHCPTGYCANLHCVFVAFEKAFTLVHMGEAKLELPYKQIRQGQEQAVHLLKARVAPVLTIGTLTNWGGVQPGMVGTEHSQIQPHASCNLGSCPRDKPG